MSIVYDTLKRELKISKYIAKGYYAGYPLGLAALLFVPAVLGLYGALTPTVFVSLLVVHRIMSIDVTSHRFEGIAFRQLFKEIKWTGTMIKRISTNLIRASRLRKSEHRDHFISVHEKQLAAAKADYEDAVAKERDIY